MEVLRSGEGGVALDMLHSEGAALVGRGGIEVGDHLTMGL